MGRPCYMQRQNFCWPLALSAQSLSAHTRLPTLNIHTRHRPAMDTDTHRPAMDTDTGLGMDARLAGRFRVETARPIRDRAGVVFRLVPGIGGSKLSAALPPNQARCEEEKGLSSIPNWRIFHPVIKVVSSL